MLDPSAVARLRACSAWLLDLDGTLLIGERLLPGALELLAVLERRREPRVFLTNNSSRATADYVRRLERLGVAARSGQVLTSGGATIDHLRAHTPHRSLFLIGTPALEGEMREAGFELDAADPDCVVVGYDLGFTFAKLERACALLLAGKPYYATHPDRTCITEGGLLPDIAAILAACEAVTGRAPRIIGKPYPEMVAAALGRMGASAATTAMVGDQLDTDMAMARAAGLVGVLVLTGETGRQALAGCPPEQRPALVVEDLSELAELLDG